MYAINLKREGMNKSIYDGRGVDLRVISARQTVLEGGTVTV